MGVLPTKRCSEGRNRCDWSNQATNQYRGGAGEVSANSVE